MREMPGLVEAEEMRTGCGRGLERRNREWRKGTRSCVGRSQSQLAGFRVEEMAHDRSPSLVSALTTGRSTSSACRVRGRTSEQVATFILQKIILDEVGLYYICSTPDRFYCVTQVLGTMVESLVEQPSIRLLRHIIRCYLRFSEDRRYHACIALRDTLPDRLKDGTFENLICNDPISVHWLQRLLINLYGDVSVGGLQGGFGQ
ncbi:hypothetical protein IEQ34_019921 [Dendrobium chrysotoxum]|uniref:CCR4-NOT transcription complex subunit 9 n=1 Tax=Dendrobium chrysotoxum TaxID=161865 RepID=A0AAV7G8M3_DENCH|nr:hypothetical protein IEQ34_019921 [Dendrobium chrysotoxum]